MYYLQHKINYFPNIYKLEIQNRVFNVAFKRQPTVHFDRYMRQYCLMSLWSKKSFWVLDFPVHQ
jgi:hypothetical protein